MRASFVIQKLDSLAFEKAPSPLPLSRERRGVCAVSQAQRIIQGSLLPLREKDRMRSKPHAVRVGACFPWLGEDAEAITLEWKNTSS